MSDVVDTPPARKHVLLQRYRRRKRLAMAAVLLALGGLTASLSWWLLPLGLLLVCIALAVPVRWYLNRRAAARLAKGHRR